MRTHTAMNGMPNSTRSAGITLGILAGGHATRLGGIDKAWLQRDGGPQVLRIATALSSQVDAVMVSANRNQQRYAEHVLQVVTDRMLDRGPLSGLHALATECKTPWLLTVPVDVLTFPADLIRRMTIPDERGTYAMDDDGPQPLIALWHVATMHKAIADAVDHDELAVHRVQSRLGMAPVRFDGVRFGNLNTPQDLQAAGIVLP